jgi:hypothetical protein
MYSNVFEKSWIFLLCLQTRVCAKSENILATKKKRKIMNLKSLKTNGKYKAVQSFLFAR